MTSKPLVILASARKESDTAVFVNKVLENICFDTLDLLDFHISPFSYTNNYPITDGFDKAINDLLQHQTIIFATPVYWYAMSGHLKNFFDRITDLVTVKKEIGRQLKGKSTFLIAVGTDQGMPEGFEVPFLLTSNYLELMYQGSIYHSTKFPNRDDTKNDLELFRVKLTNHNSEQQV